MNKMLSVEEVVAILESMGAFKVKHTGRSLGDHLLNTMEMMIKKNCPYEACVAGAMHSIYGTNVFKNGVIELSHRDSVKNQVGDEVENLVFLFSTVNRPHGIESGTLINYRSGKPVLTDPASLNNLRLMEAANLLEQGCSLLRFPTIYKTWQHQN